MHSFSDSSHEHITLSTFASKQMAETGAFSVPLHCTTKKAVLSVSPALVECGTVVRGESGTKSITLKNAGATGVGWKITLLKCSGRDQSEWGRCVCV
jgi:hypothetical protein